jgi:cytochrome d ubiquinol oxidase subunit II
VIAIAAIVAVGGVAMMLYAVLGGADFGGGVWDLLATGPRAQAQRDAITHAIGPVWEANHVWLIYILVLSWTCFPPAYADVAIGLYAPLSFALIGIVLRGAAFVFRNYATQSRALMRSFSAMRSARLPPARMRGRRRSH